MDRIVYIYNLLYILLTLLPTCEFGNLCNIKMEKLLILVEANNIPRVQTHDPCTQNQGKLILNSTA